MFVFWFFEDEKMERENRNTNIDIKVKGTGIYAVEKFPPCEIGETFQALEFLRCDSNHKVYRKSLWLEYTGYSIGPFKENIVHATVPGTTFNNGGHFLDVVKEGEIIID